MQNLAPIVLFIYNRPQHLRACLESLLKNEEITRSELFIFADGPKHNATAEQVEKIQQSRAIAVEKKWAKKVFLIEKEENMGLAEAIIQGVKQVVNSHGRVIVLEDDLVVGKYFLRYMNDALNKYENATEIAQISGFLFPIQTKQIQEAFLVPLGTTLGWATWKRVWDMVDFYPSDYMVLATDKKMSKKFDIDGCYPYTKMFFNQMKNSNYGSWGIRFWWHIFKSASLVVYPDYPLLQHKDKDLSGTHKGNYDFLEQINWLENYSINDFPSNIQSNNFYFSKIKSFLKFYNSFFGKVTRYIKNPKDAIKKIIERIY
jgi:Glycosyl transferase family 2